MSENMDEKLNQIKDLMNKDNMSENLTNLIGLFAKQKDSSGEQRDDSKKSEGDASNFTLDAQTLQMILKIKNVLSATKKDDSREKLLIALKPYLNKDRQDTLEKAISILKIANVMDVFTKMESSDKNA